VGSGKLPFSKVGKTLLMASDQNLLRIKGRRLYLDSFWFIRFIMISWKPGQSPKAFFQRHRFSRVGEDRKAVAKLGPGIMRSIHLQIFHAVLVANLAPPWIMRFFLDGSCSAFPEAGRAARAEKPRRASPFL
jgi:hypothetical protein